MPCCILLNFYIKPQLFKQIIMSDLSCILLNFYIKPQLKKKNLVNKTCCILLNFYIKPQLDLLARSIDGVVSY